MADSKHDPLAVPADAALASFVLLAQFLGVPAEPAQIHHDRGQGDRAYNFDDLIRIAKKLGLIARRKKAAPADLYKLPLPALVALRDGGAAILVKIDESGDTGVRHMVLKPDGQRPEIWSEEQVEAEFALAGGEADLLLMTSREHVAGQKRAFDISWFIPALIKYRRALRDVLIGSFFLQLVGLATPIFFQLVIDKVLVHQSMTTLEILAIGLATVLVFETLLSALRSWLFAHTSNRVDAELSASLFRHLVALPLSYFEARRVGDSVARVRELENIRNFLTSNAVTVVIDLFFTIVFFAVMYLYSPMLTLIVALTVPVYVLISVFITPSLRARLDEKFKRGALTQQRAESQADLAAARAGIAKLEEALPYIDQQLNARAELVEKGYYSRLKLLEYEQMRAEHIRNIEVQQANGMRAEASIGRLDAEIRSLSANFGKTAVTDLAEANDRASMASEELRKAERRRQFQELRAPVDGVVQQLAVSTVGGVVQPAQPLMVIVPCSTDDSSDSASCNGGVTVEAFVQNKDIGFVGVGQRVAVKLEAFNFTDFGLIDGTVTNISRDAIDQSQQPAGSGRDANGRPIQPGLVYAARISLACAPGDPARHTLCDRVQPGMAVQAEIKTGQRRIIQYLLSPISKAMSEAGRER